MSNPNWPKSPLSGAWWVQPPSLLAGPHPGHLDSAVALARFESLFDAGLRVFINLQEPTERNRSGELFADYAPLAYEIAKSRGVPVVFHRFPVVDVNVPTVEIARLSLAVIRESVKLAMPVYLSCWGGTGRSAVIAGCWLREQGMSGDEALAAIENLRKRSDVKPLRPSPETDSQRQFVHGWQR